MKEYKKKVNNKKRNNKKINNKKINNKEMNEINNNKSFFQIQSSAFQVMKRFHTLDRSLIPLFILSAILKGILPYLPVLFSKPILNALIYQDYRIATIDIVILSVSLFFSHLIENLLDYELRIHGENVSKKVKAILYEHPLELDYESLEDGKLMDHFMEALLSMQYKTNYYDLLNQYAMLGASLVSFLISISLVLNLCFSIGNGNIPWLNAITKPWVSILSLLVILIIVNGALNRIVSWSKNKIFELFQEKIKSEKAAMALYGMMSDDELIKAVQTFDGNKMIFSTFHGAMLNIKTHYIKEIRYMIMEVISKASFGSLITIFSYLLVGVKILARAISLGSFVQYTQAITKMNDAISQVVSSKVSISESVMYFEELLKFLDIRNKFETGSIPVEKRNDHEYELAFEHVWYRYPGQEEYVLKDINLKLNLHGKNALVGTNGAGKTTLIKLLCRLYEPTKGRITLNGVDIKKYNYQEYLSLFSVVFQDFGLTNYSLAENVACSMKYDKEKILTCLHKAGLTNFDDKLEDTISAEEGTKDSMIAKEGLVYSGGQQQKIAIARALYKDAPVVILDEPTAALDPLSEFDIYQRFNELIQDRMCVYISHRMSSCRFCTDIIVLNNGMVEERGSHEELLKNNMLYAKMWLAQAKYYQG